MITVQGVDYLEDNYQLDAGAEAPAEGQRSGLGLARHGAASRGPAAPFFPFDDQLAARRADVAAAALPHRHRRPCSASIRAKRLTRASAGRSYGMPGAAFSGSRFTFAFTSASSRTSRRASSGVSFTPAEQHVLEGDPAALAYRESPARRR